MDFIIQNWEYIAIFILMVDKIIALSPSKMDDLIWTSVKEVFMKVKVMKEKS